MASQVGTYNLAGQQPDPELDISSWLNLWEGQWPSVSSPTPPDSPHAANNAANTPFAPSDLARSGMKHPVASSSSSSSPAQSTMREDPPPPLVPPCEPMVLTPPPLIPAQQEPPALTGESVAGKPLLWLALQCDKAQWNLCFDRTRLQPNPVHSLITDAHTIARYTVSKQQCLSRLVWGRTYTKLVQLI